MKRSLAVAAAATLTLALAGCASANKNASGSSSSLNADATMTTSGSGSAGAVAGSDSSMKGMTMSSNGTGTATIVNSAGVATPVPTKQIGTGTWKDMSIQALEMTPVPFYVYDGTSSRELKPPKGTSFHLMVMLSDKHTGEPIPYATVWVYIYKGAKLVYNERQWDMLSEYMGPHYGNDVTLPGSGKYTLKVQVTAPEAAMHVEYGNMWTGTHTTTSTFTWSPPSSS